MKLINSIQSFTSVINWYQDKDGDTFKVSDGYLILTIINNVRTKYYPDGTHRIL